MNNYTKSNPHYSLYFGKISTQELHYWARDATTNQTKWVYFKDPNISWINFYNALHKNPPTSEKIVNWYYHGGGYTEQIWAFIM